MCKTPVACVALDGAVGTYDKLYSYLIPDSLVNSAVPGCRVSVPFGRGDRKRIGMIFALSEIAEGVNYKHIISVVDDSPMLNCEQLKLCVYMHDNLFCTYFDAVNVMLPAGLRFKLADYYSVNPEFVSKSLLDDKELTLFSAVETAGEVSADKLKDTVDDYKSVLLSLTDKDALIHTAVPKRNMCDFTRKYVRVSEEYTTGGLRLTARQQEAVDAVYAAGEVSVKELQYFTGVSLSVVNALISKGVFSCFEKQEFRMPPRKVYKSIKNTTVLNDGQNAAFSGLREKMFSDTGETALLYGVTGSGKTQVFLKLADEAIGSGLGAIIMVPEIALTPQMINLFSARYGNLVAVFHSAMSLGQRMDEYRRIAAGKAMIAVGTRSAVFAPFEKLGLIVIDEEQEHTYKSEKSPRFHARDIARLRAKYHKGLLLLSSATPSLESYSRATIGKYGFYKLTRRYNEVSLPQVQIVNMREELQAGNSSNISRELASRIDIQLNSGKQAIILLNRRGHNTYVSCQQCGYVASCDNCSISLTYHSANKRLMCHYCGYSMPVPDKCPECGCEYLSFSGVGTQRIQEELSTLFPKARILRLDADSTMTRDSYSKHLSDFANGEYDIMIGTQMVAKGLDFPNVSLVGVIGADRAMAGDDYRSFERTFDLLTQVVGRAGRADGNGIAVVQTSDTDNHIIELAQVQDYEQFFNEEISARNIKIFPPYCDLCLIWTQSVSDSAARAGIGEIFNNIKNAVSNEFSDQHLIILGPGAAYIPRVAGKYRYKMLIKCKNSARFRKLIRESTFKLPKGEISVGIDINPESVI